MLTSVLDGAVYTTITHLDPLLLLARAQRVKCHHNHAQVENANLSHPLPLFFFIKEK